MGITFTRSIPTLETSNQNWRATFVGLLSFAALLYIGSFGGEMVWDDHILLDGSAIGGGDTLLHCFNRQFMFNYYRPLVSTAFYFERQAFGGRLLGYHLVSLLFHLLTVCFVIGLAKELTGNRRSAMIAGFFFAVQPVQVSATAWLGGRTDAMACCWSALFGWMILKAATEQGALRVRYLAIGSLAFLLAIFTKEQTLALLPLVPLVFYIRSRIDDRTRLDRSFWCTVPFVVIAVLFVVIGSHVGLPHPNGVVYTTVQRIEFVGNSVWHYLQLLTVPGPLSLHAIGFSGFENGMTWKVYCGLAILVASALAFMFSLKRDRAIAFCLAWVGLTMVPVLNIIPAPFLLLGPYRGALAGIGVVVLFGYIVEKVLQPISTDRQKIHPLAHSGFMVLIGMIGCWQLGMTLSESVQWRNEEKVFRNFLDSDPENIMMLQTMGIKQQNLDKPMSASKFIETALERVFGVNWRDRAHALSMMYKGSPAYNHIKQFQGSDGDPSHWAAKTFCLLGESYAKLERLSESEEMFIIAEKFDRSFVRIHTGLGGLYEKENIPELAMDRFRIATELEPENVYSVSHLAKLLADAHRFRESTAYYERWVALEPKSQVASDSLIYTKTELLKSGN